MRPRTLAFIALTAAAAMGATQAQSSWPDKPIRVVLPFPPGGPSDIVMRLAAEKMQLTLKQPVVIENKPGAGGNLGSAEVARAAPDGHAWLWGTDTLVTVNPHVYKQIGYKTEDLTPVTIGTSFSQTLVCHPRRGREDACAELVAKAKAERPDELRLRRGRRAGAPVDGTAAEHGRLRHDPTYPTRARRLPRRTLLGNQVPCGLLAGPTVLPHVRRRQAGGAGRVGQPCVRSTLPDVPTMAEAGVPGYRGQLHAGDVRAASGTPRGDRRRAFARPSSMRSRRPT